jgi:hypothetical protein
MTEEDKRNHRVEMTCVDESRLSVQFGIVRKASLAIGLWPGDYKAYVWEGGFEVPMEDVEQFVRNVLSVYIELKLARKEKP